MAHTHLPIVLTIAGSDSGGGAGIQADLKTFHQFGVFGTSVVTAVTAQNTVGVRAVHPVPTEVVRAQLEALWDDLVPQAVKTGMLAAVAIVEVVAEMLDRRPDIPLVLDPVMVATSGDRLLDVGAEAAILARLLPRSTLVTPNRQEAELLTNAHIESVADAEQAARRLVDMGAAAALVKGGHSVTDTETLVDVYFDGTLSHFEHPRIDSPHTHGTGCTLSAAATAALARGRTPAEAVRYAIDFVVRGIAEAPGLGAGHGPLNHFVDTDV